MGPDLSRLQLNLGYRFKDIDLLRRALSHRSSGADHNERLEFLGDSLVNMAIAELLFHEFSNAPEGDLSAMRALLVCQDSLASTARVIKLGDYLLLGTGTSKTGGHRLDSILADTYEALIGALYLDSDWGQVTRTVREHFSTKLNEVSDLGASRDAKSRLQEWLQASKYPLPNYQVIEVEGPGHAQNFQVRCDVEPLSGQYIGKGSSRRKAEQNAAEEVLKAIAGLSENSGG